MNPAVLQPGGGCDGGRAALSSGYDAAYPTVSPDVSGYVHASPVLLAVVGVDGYCTHVSPK